MQVTRKRLPSLGIDLTNLAADLTSLRTAIAAQSSFVGVSPQDTLVVNVALSAALSDIAVAAGEAETALAANGGAVGGVVGGEDGARLAWNFTQYFAVASQEPDLIDLESFLTRMQVNIALGGSTSSDTTVN